MRNICTVGDCGRFVHGRGYCITHYGRWRRTGDPGPAETLRINVGKICSVASCREGAKTRGWCRRHYRLAWKYDIDPSEYQDLLDVQGGVCAICRQEEESFGNHGEIKLMAVDHDHETGEVRGILCSYCNRGLGFLRDDPGLLRAALAYLGE